MTRRRWLRLSLTLVVLGAPVAAAASVPDPSWIGGLYDGADGDELVALVWDQSPGLEASAVVIAPPPSAASPPPAAGATAGGACATSAVSRAPPAA
ncbi:MAG TPA: hypothetical protein VKG64_15195 [Methylomirabilota bacterium]|jgi:hypothetical protein|nr:hypothetical protein [Methylomirabilota bacterium]